MAKVEITSDSIRREIKVLCLGTVTWGSVAKYCPECLFGRSERKWQMKFWDAVLFPSNESPRKCHLCGSLELCAFKFKSIYQSKHRILQQAWFWLIFSGKGMRPLFREELSTSRQQQKNSKVNWKEIQLWDRRRSSRLWETKSISRWWCLSSRWPHIFFWIDSLSKTIFGGDLGTVNERGSLTNNAKSKLDPFRKNGLL